MYRGKGEISKKTSELPHKCNSIYAMKITRKFYKEYFVLIKFTCTYLKLAEYLIITSKA